MPEVIAHKKIQISTSEKNLTAGFKERERIPSWKKSKKKVMKMKWDWIG